MNWRGLDRIFEFMIKALTIAAISILVFIIGFILKESLPLFKEISPVRFIAGTSWRPLSNTPSIGILPIILSTIYISALAVVIALPFGIGCAVFLSCFTSIKIRALMKPFIDMLTGIPSVIYGFMGLLIIVKFFEVKFSAASGESVLAGGILLSIMILPFIISTCDESMAGLMAKYRLISNSMGVSKSYMVTHLILPSSMRSILAGVVLSLGRAMGETMAVMMVIGNAPIMPRLMGKAETIPALIALEMGTAQVDSIHYHGLFAAGFVLMILLIIINTILYKIRKSIIK